MKVSLFTVLALLTLSATAFADIEVLDGKPKRAYKIISPVSADKNSEDKAFASIKRKAERLNADAIIDLECNVGERVRTGLLQLRTVGTSSTCHGMAVSWQ